MCTNNDRVDTITWNQLIGNINFNGIARVWINEWKLRPKGNSFVVKIEVFDGLSRGGFLKNEIINICDLREVQMSGWKASVFHTLAVIWWMPGGKTVQTRRHKLLNPEIPIECESVEEELSTKVAAERAPRWKARTPHVLLITTCD